MDGRAVDPIKAALVWAHMPIIRTWVVGQVCNEKFPIFYLVHSGSNVCMGRHYRREEALRDDLALVAVAFD
jgi:hypothetical protein